MHGAHCNYSVLQPSSTLGVVVQHAVHAAVDLGFDINCHWYYALVLCAAIKCLVVPDSAAHSLHCLQGVTCVCKVSRVPARCALCLQVEAMALVLTPSETPREHVYLGTCVGSIQQWANDTDSHSHIINRVKSVQIHNGPVTAMVYSEQAGAIISGP